MVQVVEVGTCRGTRACVVKSRMFVWPPSLRMAGKPLEHNCNRRFGAPRLGALGDARLCAGERRPRAVRGDPMTPMTPPPPRTGRRVHMHAVIESQRQAASEAQAGRAVRTCIHTRRSHATNAAQPVQPRGTRSCSPRVALRHSMPLHRRQHGHTRSQLPQHGRARPWDRSVFLLLA